MRTGRKDWPSFDLEVLYEDNHLLVVHKPAGLLSQGDDTRDPSILDLARAYLKERHKKPGRVYLGLVQRLDRPVSGVMVLARTSKAARRLAQQIRERQVTKLYRAVVQGRLDLEEATLVHYLQKRGQRHRVAVFDEPAPHAKPAELRYRSLGFQAGLSLLEIELITGRSHQIRAQLAATGHPVLWDVRYGSRFTPPGSPGLALHARSLRLIHPTLGEELCFDAVEPAPWPWPPPCDLEERTAGHRHPSTERARLAPRVSAVPRSSPDLHVRPAIDLLHLDEDLVAVNKPAGLPVQRTLDPNRPNLLDLLTLDLAKRGDAYPPALLTRLPAPASGIVLLAHSRAGARSLEAQIKGQSLRRLFLFVLKGPLGGSIEPGRWLTQEGPCRVCLIAPPCQGAFLLAVEPLERPGRAIEGLLREKRWSVCPARWPGDPSGAPAPERPGAGPRAARRELRHLHRVRLRTRSREDAFDIVAPLPDGMAAWRHGGLFVPFPAPELNP